MLITTSSVGLPPVAPGIFLASQGLNNWCYGDCDFSQQPKLKLTKDGQRFEIEGEGLLTVDSEFKLIVPHLGAERASAAYAARMDAAKNCIGGVHVDRRYDFDPATGHFWLLADSHMVVKQGHWNQNNVYSATH